MPSPGFFEKYDEATLVKLEIFELYAQEWIPVFLAREQPDFASIDIFDFFCGPGSDSEGELGSPLRILRQLREYHDKQLAGWGKAPVNVYFSDENKKLIAELEKTLSATEWKIPGVKVECLALPFKEALNKHEQLLLNGRATKLLFIDQFGVDEVSDDVFEKLVSFRTTDFMFFLSSSTLHRFRDHPLIKQKIGPVADSYDVHRAVVDYYRQRVPTREKVFLAPFSIKKRSYIYGLIFCSHHPLGIHKFLRVAWDHDEIAGEANFDIDREHITPGELLLDLPEMRPSKLRIFEMQLEQKLRDGAMKSEADVVRFCIEAGMTCQHSAPVLSKLKSKGVISLSFRVPDVQRLGDPRPIVLK